MLSKTLKERTNDTLSELRRRKEDAEWEYITLEDTKRRADRTQLLREVLAARTRFNEASKRYSDAMTLVLSASVLTGSLVEELEKMA